MLTYEQEQTFIKNKKQALAKAITNAKRGLKKLALKRDCKEYLNNANEYVTTVQDILDDIKYQNYTEYHDLRHKLAGIEKFNDDCWNYCQGDNRITL